MPFGFMSLKETWAEVKTPGFWTDVLCEALVAFFLLFGAWGVGIQMPGGPPRAVVSIGLVGGLYVYVLIEAFGHIQWAVQNPVVSMLFACTKRISVLKAVVYIGVQLAGGTAAVALLGSCVSPVKIKAMKPAHDVTSLAAVAVEWVITAILAFVVLGALDIENRKPNPMPGLPIGTTIALGIIAALPISGGVLNPAIAFGGAAYLGDWERHWVYWVGDFAGAICALLLYYLFVNKGRFKQRHNPIPMDESADLEIQKDPVNNDIGDKHSSSSRL